MCVFVCLSPQGEKGATASRGSLLSAFFALLEIFDAAHGLTIEVPCARCGLFLVGRHHEIVAVGESAESASVFQLIGANDASLVVLSLLHLGQPKGRVSADDHINIVIYGRSPRVRGSQSARLMRKFEVPGADLTRSVPTTPLAGGFGSGRRSLHLLKAEPTSGA